MIKNIIFDFDGVICESVNIKTEAFYEMYLPEGKEIALKVKEHHLANGGMSRFDKFSYYEKVFLKRDLSEERMQKLSEVFSRLVKKKVIEAPFVEGAYGFLEKHADKYKCFIVSATPMEEMKEIAEKKNIDQYFDGIFGSPKNKIEWGKYILDTYSINADETLFIGDAMNDYTAAKANKMQFLLRKTMEKLPIPASTIQKKDLQDLHDFITKAFA